MIKDLPGELYDVCPNTGMPLMPGQNEVSDEEIEEFFEHCQENVNEGYI